MANPARAIALSGTNLLSVDPVNPTNATTIAITNIAAGETLVGIDFRPQNGFLYGLGVNAATNTATLYAISTRTGVAAIVGGLTPGQITLTTDGVTLIDLPDPATVGYSFDFNPAVDRIRVTTESGLNFRINPTTGLAVDTDGVTAGNQPDTPLNGGSTSVAGAAYTNNAPNAAVTTLYTLDAATNSLFIQNPANGGTQTAGQLVTFNGATLDFTQASFDIAAGVNAPATGAPVLSGSGYALLTVGGTTALYSIDLTTAVATLVGNLLDGATPTNGLAMQSELAGIPVVALTADGLNLVRFSTATPGTTTTVGITNIAAGERLIGIDFRPATGQLYGFGVNSAADTGTVYFIDPQTGGATAIGAAIGGMGDLPDPATAGYGFDFNPAVDRIRITTDTGLNFRLNPNNGTLSGSDTPINGGATGVSAAAYTNSYHQQLGVVGAPTVLYTLDPASDTLFIQSNPNGGVETAGHAVTLGGSPLDFTSVSGFDIPASVLTTALNTAVPFGVGFAALTVGGVTGLYRIDLVTGEATSLGSIGAGATALAGLALGDAPSAPRIVSNGGGDAASFSIAENTAAVTTVTAFDATRFSISGGADAAKFQINASTGALSFITAPDFEARADADFNNSYIVQVRATAGSSFDSQTITVNVTDLNDAQFGNGLSGDDTFTAPAGNARIEAGGGVDTIRFNFKLVDATVSYYGNQVVITSASSSTVVTGFEKYVFTDGTVDNWDASSLVDDLFYYSHNHDVWNAHVDADAHYNTFGWHEGRDPNAFFSTTGYLTAYADVQAAGVNPLGHFHAFGWLEGRDPSVIFDVADYLAANPDVAAAHVDPLEHFLVFGHQEARVPFNDGAFG
jgi:hypothetical protein